MSSGLTRLTARRERVARQVPSLQAQPRPDEPRPDREGDDASDADRTRLEDPAADPEPLQAGERSEDDPEGHRARAIRARAGDARTPRGRPARVRGYPLRA